jgi:hypothetical protein
MKKEKGLLDWNCDVDSTFRNKTTASVYITTDTRIGIWNKKKKNWNRRRARECFTSSVYSSARETVF